MSIAKVLVIVVAAAASGFLGWGAVEWKQQQGRAAAFEARQLALATEEHGRLKEEVTRLLAAKAELPEISEGATLSALQDANTLLRNQLTSHREAADEAVELEWRKKIETATARIRELEFKEPVSYNVLDRSQIGQVLEQKFAEQYTDEEFSAMVDGYVAMGLIPKDYPLKQTYIDLLSEQIAAFYDQHSHKLFMFKGASLSNAQNRVILSHELTHALQDQHFTLRNLPLELKNNDDRVLAASSLVEGDATMEMNFFMLEDMSPKSAMQTMTAALSQSLDKLISAPRILRESLLFPYMEGAKFCAALQERGLYFFDQVDKAYQRVPSSTTQILHPEKYFNGEEPIGIEWSSLEWKGEKPTFDNVMGEFATRTLLTEWGLTLPEASKAAEGWRGDRYLVFRKGEAFVWGTVWNDREEAQEFLSAVRTMMAKRYGSEMQPLPTGTGQKIETPERAIVIGEGAKGLEYEVWIAHAPELKESIELSEHFHKTATRSKPATEQGVEAAAQ